MLHINRRSGKEEETSAKPDLKFIEEMKSDPSDKDQSPCIVPKSSFSLMGKYKFTWEADGLLILNNTRSHLLSTSERKILKRLIRQGCPSKYRKDLWMVASGARVAMNNNPGYYEKLKECIETYPNPCFRQIELDLERTYYEEKMNGMIMDLLPLKNVLYTFAKRNSTVGYCQGLNFIVAHFLRYLSEEEAFWALCCLIESILPIDYYSAMIGVLIDQKLFSKLIKATAPVLWAHLKKMNLDPSLVSLQWFICLFSYNLKMEVSDEIWDHLLLNGSKVLFRAGLSIISLIEKNILKCKEFRKDEAFLLLEREPRSFLDIDALIQTMSLKKFKFLTNRYVSKMRNEKRRELRAHISADSSRGSTAHMTCAKYRYIIRLPIKPQAPEGSDLTLTNDGIIGVDSVELKCSEKWPICAFDHTFKNRCAVFFQYRVKHRREDEWIDNYFEEPQMFEEKKDMEDSDNLLIERNRHYCTNELFAKKMNLLLTAKDSHEEAFPTELVELPVNDSFTHNLAMQKYVDYIVKYTIPIQSRTDVKTKKKPQEMLKGEQRKVFKTMTAAELSKMCEKPTNEYYNDMSKRNSICVDNAMMLSQMQQENEPLNKYLLKLAKKTEFLNRGEDIQNSRSGRFLYGIIGSP